MFPIIFLGENTRFYLGSKIILSRTQLLAKIKEHMLSDLLLLSSQCHCSSISSRAFELVCIYKQINKPDE